jgi:hypothetical protein
MIYRNITEDIINNLERYPAVALIGPRQVGKTTLAKFLMSKISKRSMYVDLELPSDYSKMQEAEIYLKEHENACVVLDEIQRLPALFPVMRALIDQNPEFGRFILLGSATNILMKKSAESLAGRIIYKELAPFSLFEVQDKYDLRVHWLRGGFPRAVLSRNDADCFDWLRSFTSTYIEQDLPQLGLSTSSGLMTKFWIMLSHYHSCIWNSSNISRSLDISHTTVSKYIDFLQGAYIINKLEPFFINIKKRLIKSPKIYFRDSGILHSLQEIKSFHKLIDNPIIGASWEGYVIEQIYQLSLGNLKLHYYRTYDGAECDLLLCKANKPIACVEIKFSASPSITRSFTIVINDLNTVNNFIIGFVDEDYMIAKNIRVVSLKSFLSKYLPRLKEI